MIIKKTSCNLFNFIEIFNFIHLLAIPDAWFYLNKINFRSLEILSDFIW